MLIAASAEIMRIYVKFKRVQTPSSEFNTPAVILTHRHCSLQVWITPISAALHVTQQFRALWSGDLSLVRQLWEIYVHPGLSGLSKASLEQMSCSSLITQCVKSRGINQTHPESPRVSRDSPMYYRRATWRSYEGLCNTASLTNNHFWPTNFIRHFLIRYDVVYFFIHAHIPYIFKQLNYHCHYLKLTLK